MQSEGTHLATLNGAESFINNKTKVNVDRIEVVTGGYANYIFRATLQQPWRGANSIILKHASPYLPGNKSFALSVLRSDQEASMLQFFSPLSTLPPMPLKIRVPKLYDFDEQNNVLLLEDLGGLPTLKQHIMNGNTEAEHNAQMSRSLANFLRHIQAEGKKILDKQNFNKNIQILEIVAWREYGRFDETCDLLHIEHIKPELKLVSKYMTDHLENNKPVLVHGDLWPGNILVSTRKDTSEPEELFVLDWEMCRFSSEAVELGQITAEFLMLMINQGYSEASIRLLTCFLESYGPLKSKQDVKNVAIHAGSHLLTWPVRITNWGDEEKIEQVTKLGLDLVLKAYHDDFEWLERSYVALLLPK